ncbi:MAG: thioredoxin fold domain-containing protein [Gammaproteobacteria bacterium]|nr:thioredoxin fold domain-containing protein [Gammaproteobacteria bacterium]
MERFYQKTALFIVTILIFSLSQAANRVPQLIITTDLQETAQTASKKNLLIILYAAYVDCTYCALLEEEILLPMLIDDSYDDKILIRKIMIDDDDDNIISFSGKPATIEQLNAHYQMDFAPTLLFLDPDGNEIAKRMVGINTPELYAAYLDNNIKHALRTIRE